MPANACANIILHETPVVQKMLGTTAVNDMDVEPS